MTRLADILPEPKAVPIECKSIYSAGDRAYIRDDMTCADVEYLSRGDDAGNPDGFRRKVLSLVCDRERTGTYGRLSPFHIAPTHMEALKDGVVLYAKEQKRKSDESMEALMESVRRFSEVGFRPPTESFSERIRDLAEANFRLPTVDFSERITEACLRSPPASVAERIADADFRSPLDGLSERIRDFAEADPYTSLER